MTLTEQMAVTQQDPEKQPVSKDDDNNGKDKGKKCLCSGSCFVTYLLKYQIPIFLLIGIVFGYFVPQQGVWISNQGVPLGSVFVVRRNCEIRASVLVFVVASLLVAITLGRYLFDFRDEIKDGGVGEGW